MLWVYDLFLSAKRMQDADGPTAMQLDAYVDVERLAEAMSELDKYIEAARAQLFEIRKKKVRVGGFAYTYWRKQKSCVPMAYS